MTAGIIIIIIILGLVLISLEVIVLPGTHLFGILGGLALLTGVILIYTNYGSNWGDIAVACSLVALAAAVYAGFRTIQSNRLAMKAEITGKVNEFERNLYNVGDRGIAASELRPNGKAVFHDNKIEVFSTGEYIKRDSELIITKVTNDRIFVKQFKT